MTNEQQQKRLVDALMQIEALLKESGLRNYPVRAAYALAQNTLEAVALAEGNVDVKFFFYHAGSSYDPKKETLLEGKLRGARQLAQAEEWANVQGYECRWHPDDEKGQECCVLVDPASDETAILASLSGIEGATAEYRRVVEAELALEAMSQAQSEVRKFVESHEDDDIFDPEELERIFALAYNRQPTDDDRQLGLWSLICAMV